MLYHEEDEVEERIESTNLPVVEYKKIRDSGKTPGVKDKSIEEKAVIGTLANIVGPVEASRMMECSDASASHYSKGRSNHLGVDEELQKRVKQRGELIQDAVTDKLLESVGLIDLNKIAEHKDPTAIVRAAKDLSSIVKDQKSDNNENQGNKINITIYTPRVASLEKFDTLEINCQPTK